MQISVDKIKAVCYTLASSSIGFPGRLPYGGRNMLTIYMTGGRIQMTGGRKEVQRTGGRKIRLTGGRKDPTDVMVDPEDFLLQTGGR